MSHCSLSPEQKGVMGISENLLRLSVGSRITAT
jgi:cystathionine gamma-lyase